MKSTLFPEWEIVTEIEPMRMVDVKDAVKAMEGVSLTKEEGDDDLADLEETEVDVDKAFLKFQKRVEVEPQQVLRLVRLYSDPGDGEVVVPLWVADTGKVDLDSVPVCEYCSSKQTFEFQIMPQLLSYLSVDHSRPDSLDWGTMMVFSCSKYCQPTEGGNSIPYMPCFIARQDFSAAGMGDSARKLFEERAKAPPTKDPETPPDEEDKMEVA
ncbi:Programmed cell death protein 2 [Blyttiomyces sp. JEL0837]|nr:Programmed cell death protein 2 [Blyttiomyces sp. JEL0837]